MVVLPRTFGTVFPPLQASNVERTPSSYGTIVIPGLFQTHQYFRHGAPNLVRRSVNLSREDRLAIRPTRRKGILDHAFPPRISVLLDEPTIHRVIGEERDDVDPASLAHSSIRAKTGGNTTAQSGRPASARRSSQRRMGC
ncbi:Scr1 family TA system antitoxin-like transcriptional regulator [Asanoa sp. NPDC049573]|uniref:Scr1 family TA system antitoxin-like transcriptional regulator n=1 Tax=Asanoa sp. NPDC049573 TaxID=3155396 RepID=UPI0034207162